MRLLITCPSGFVSTLNQELKFLRFSPTDSFDTGTYVETDNTGMMRINLRSRIASKVYIVMGSTPSCTTFDQLFQATQTINRTDRLPASEFLHIEAHCFQSTLISENATQSIVHKAILSQLMQHGTAIMHTTHEPYEVMVQIIKNTATWFLNSSGVGLHKRGYRQEQGSASLKENVAAGLVLMSGRRRQQQLWDPCCGSGTICIEAALIARNVAPGSRRSFQFAYFVNHSPSVRQQLKQEAVQKSYPDKKFTLFGSDIDLELIEKARANAERAGVADTIHFFEHDCISEASPLVESGDGQEELSTVLITNPPYGKRLAPEGLKDLYRALIKLSAAPKTHLTCITSYPEFAHLLSTHRPRKDVKNGADSVHVRMKPKG